MKILPPDISYMLVASLRMLERSLDHSLTGSFAECEEFFRNRSRLEGLWQIYKAINFETSKTEPKKYIRKPLARFSPLVLLSLVIGRPIVSEAEYDATGRAFLRGLEVARDIVGADRQEIIQTRTDIWIVEHLLADRLRPSKSLESAIAIEHYHSPDHIETIPVQEFVNLAQRRSTSTQDA